VGGGAARLEVVLLACPQLLREVARPTRPARLDMLHAYLPHVRLRARAGGLMMLREHQSAVTKSLPCDKLVHYGSVNPSWKRQSIGEESVGCGAGRGARLEFPRELFLEALGVRVQVGLRRRRAPARASASSCDLRFEKERVKWLRERERERERGGWGRG